MTAGRALVLITAALLGAGAAADGSLGAPDRSSAAGAGGRGRPVIVVTYPILGSLVNDLVGDSAEVVVPMPNGQDPHEWEPSARDMEAIMRAALVVRNGLGLEGGMEKTLQAARKAGVRLFTASEHVSILHLPDSEASARSVGDQPAGAADPHLWTDPLAMKGVVAALASEIHADFGIRIDARAAELERRLTELDQEVGRMIDSLPRAAACWSPAISRWGTSPGATASRWRVPSSRASPPSPRSRLPIWPL